MKFKKEYFYCSPKLLVNVPELSEIEKCISNIRWTPAFKIKHEGKLYENQTGYNKAFEEEFSHFQWESQPVLNEEVKFIGDFRKNDIFIEIQFGHSATLFRDYYKFHYGITNHLLWLAVLIVPTKPTKFFPTRPESVSNMAEFNLACKYFNLIKIPVPILLYGLEPEN